MPSRKGVCPAADIPGDPVLQKGIKIPLPRRLVQILSSTQTVRKKGNGIQYRQLVCESEYGRIGPIMSAFRHTCILRLLSAMPQLRPLLLPQPSILSPHFSFYIVFLCSMDRKYPFLPLVNYHKWQGIVNLSRKKEPPKFPDRNGLKSHLPPW